MFKNIFSK